MFGSPKDLWNPAVLLSRRFNFGLAEAVPNILVGVGLFFTFVFLSWALVDTTATLTQANSTARQTEQAISELLKVAGGKFLTSLAGLLASIAWTYKSKLALNDLSKACDSLIDILVKVVPSSGAEMLLRAQLEIANDGLGMTEEILTEAREQTGVFKRFETEWAVAWTKAFHSQTEALVAAIDGLSKKLGTINQEGIERMMKEFAGMLQKIASEEMDRFREVLSDVSTKLDKAGERLETSASHFESAADSVASAMDDLNITVREASGIGKQGADFINQTLDKTKETLQSLGSISGELVAVADSLQSVGDNIAVIVDNVEELSREQRSVVAAVREVAPKAQAAVERVAGILEVAGKQTKDSIEATAATLGKTVASITEGVTSYTNQVADLHRKMDGHLAKAVSSFDKGVNELAESVEELADIMQKSKGA